jgi:hypothetical protein
MAIKTVIARKGIAVAGYNLASKGKVGIVKMA